MEDITNKLAGVSVKADKTPLTPCVEADITPSLESSIAVESEGNDVFPMLPSTEDPAVMMSPNEPPSRRSSDADIEAVEYLPEPLSGRLPGLRRASSVNKPELKRTPSAKTGITAQTGLTTNPPTVFSLPTLNNLLLEDRIHEQTLDEIEDSIPSIPADQIPTEKPKDYKPGPADFNCSFGWTGDEAEDLKDTPLTTIAYLEKLVAAKSGITLMERAITGYKLEINKPRNHGFSVAFVMHQSRACTVVLDQLQEISNHIDEITEDVEHFIGDNEDALREKLIAAYKAAIPWIQRTQRLVLEAHVWFKLNYVLSRTTKTEVAKAKQESSKVKNQEVIKARLPTIPAGRVVSHPQSERK